MAVERRADSFGASIADPGVRLNGVELPVATEGLPLVLLPGSYLATGPPAR
ncbi:hypothetical protein NKG94_48060 [Micromonospora sp. M12]